MEENGSSTPRSRTERFDHWVRHSPPILILGLSLFLFVTIGGAIHYGRNAIDWLHQTYDWRSAEYARLNRLHSDFTLAAFEAALGPPLFENASRNHRWTQYLFRGRGYWVQALTHKGGNTVEAYSVTACDRSLRPTFKFFDSKITLNQSRLSDPKESGTGRFSYTLPADAAPLFYLTVGGYRVSNFQSAAWGADGACSSQAVRTLEFMPPKGMNAYTGTMRFGRVPARFSHALVVNTFAAWGPTAYAWPNSSFHMGVDEFHIEAVSGNS